ncbi:hypothetical protein BK121_08750 [Paenibacillus odorifer]|uniref:hypothetical protein n=1 Tax=Paenibacillus odorifer TaxID=189426 RepID=UPI00096BDADE|nr:hypothetical protein [Paenibacillus odorifer]OMC72990.1 hypothetical protein BK121_08750 [Paenibacillus odorifer]
MKKVMLECKNLHENEGCDIQGCADLISSLHIALSLDVENTGVVRVSLYSLTVEEKTALELIEAFRKKSSIPIDVELT